MSIHSSSIFLRHAFHTSPRALIVPDLLDDCQWTALQFDCYYNISITITDDGHKPVECLTMQSSYIPVPHNTNPPHYWLENTIEE